MSVPSNNKFSRFYDEFRDCEFNKEYYSKRVEYYRTWIKVVDSIIALFLAGFGITGLSFWKTEIYGFAVGQISLTICATLAVVLFTLKPYLKFEDKIEKLSGMMGTYYSLAHTHKNLVRRITEQQKVDGEAEAIFNTLRELRGALSRDEEANPPVSLKEKCQDIVNKRFPTESFYYPDNKK